MDGGLNAQSVDRNASGILVGADAGLGNGWRAGVLGGYSHGSLDGNDSASVSGHASIDSYHLGLYGGSNWGATSLRLGTAYAWNRIKSDRIVVFATASATPPRPGTTAAPPKLSPKSAGVSTPAPSRWNHLPNWPTRT